MISTYWVFYIFQVHKWRSVLNLPLSVNLILLVYWLCNNFIVFFGESLILFGYLFVLLFEGFSSGLIVIYLLISWDAGLLVRVILNWIISLLVYTKRQLGNWRSSWAHNISSTFITITAQSFLNWLFATMQS